MSEIKQIFLRRLAAEFTPGWDILRISEQFVISFSPDRQTSTRLVLETNYKPDRVEEIMVRKESGSRL